MAKFTRQQDIAYHSAVIFRSLFMNVAASDFIPACTLVLDRYFSAHPNPELRSQALKALRFIATDEQTRSGKAEGWAAGLLYHLVNRYCRAFGIPGMLNADFEALMGVTMSAVRRRAGAVERILEI